MGPKGEIERLSAGRMEIPLSEGIDGTMFEKFSWSRERYCEKRLIILSLPSSSSSSSACTPLFFSFSFFTFGFVSRGAGTCRWPIAAISAFPFLLEFRRGFGSESYGRDGIKWTLVGRFMMDTWARRLLAKVFLNSHLEKTNVISFEGIVISSFDFTFLFGLIKIKIYSNLLDSL